MLPSPLFSYNFQFNSQACNECSVFVALETGSRSGAEFIKDALAKGAKIVISQKPIEGMDIITVNEVTATTINGNIVAEDSLLFVQSLARQKFAFLKRKGIKTIGITGSVGKTTTKEFIATTLLKYGKVHATQDNYNNHIGLPFTILNAPLDSNFLVLEMGMNHEGEIKFLVGIAPCEWNIITNAKESHAGNFPNGEQGVLWAKFEIMASNGKCFATNETFERFLSDKKLLNLYNKNNLHRINTQPVAHIDNGKTSFNFDGRSFFLDGVYSNAQVEMLCTAISLMDDALQRKVEKIQLKSVKGRGDIVEWHGIKVINESYNASPTSIKNALENFKTFNGKKLCILGEIRELGKDSQKYHQTLEPHLQYVDGVILVGKEMQILNINNAKYFEDYATCLDFLKTNGDFLTTFDCILVKASNGVGLWRLFNDLFI